MPNYQNGKQYKLVSKIDGELLYVGSSTKLYLCQRMGDHRTAARSGETSKIYRRMREIGIENVDIILIENYPCESKDELRAREDYLIHELKPTCNQRGAFLDEETKRARRKVYVDMNGATIRAWSNAKCECACGGRYTKANKTVHAKSKKHQRHVAEAEERAAGEIADFLDWLLS